MKVLIILAHPRFEDSYINKLLIDSVNDLPQVTIRDLYEEYPDFNIDIYYEQLMLCEHDIIIWQHPFYWYSAPPLLKQWIDLVLEYGWAYGKDGHNLKGKYVFNCISTGGGKDAYQYEGRNRFPINVLLSPFDQTAFLCEMIYLPPFVIHNANKLSKEESARYAENYRYLISNLTNESIQINSLSGLENLNNLI